MILKVAIEPGVGEEVAGAGRLPAPLLVRFLKERCLLVGESDEAFAHLLRAFDTSPIELVEVVYQLVRHRRCLPLPDPAPTRLDSLEAAEHVESWQEAAELLVLVDNRVELLEELAPRARPEQSSLRDFLNSQAVSRTLEDWDRPVEENDRRDTVWRDRFAPLAQHTNDIFIVDKFAIWQLASALKHKQERGRVGAQWFLGLLARSRVQRIHLASSARERAHGMGTDEAIDIVHSWFRTQSTTKQLELFLVDGNFDHGRRIAFDGWAGFDIHNGLASFDHDPIREGFGMNASPALGAQVVAEFRRLTR